MNVCVINEIRKLNNYLEKRSKDDKEFFNTNIWYTSFNIGDNGFYMFSSAVYGCTGIVTGVHFPQSSFDYYFRIRVYAGGKGRYDGWISVRSFV